MSLEKLNIDFVDRKTFLKDLTICQNIAIFLKMFDNFVSFFHFNATGYYLI